MPKSKKSAKPKPRSIRPEPSGLVCALYRRQDSSWKVALEGEIQRYPRLNEAVIVARSKTKFIYTKPILEVLSIETKSANAIDIVFQDEEGVWKLVFPAHTNDIETIKAELA